MHEDPLVLHLQRALQGEIQAGKKMGAVLRQQHVHMLQSVTRGIVVDDRLQTSVPDIFAASDVCSFPHALYGRRVRVECWKNADDQGRIAARKMLGEDRRDREVPWF